MAEAPGIRLRKSRERLNLTQVELAQRLDLSSKTISKYENGDSDVPAAVFGELGRLLRAADRAEAKTLGEQADADWNRSQVFEAQRRAVEIWTCKSMDPFLVANGGNSYTEIVDIIEKFSVRHAKTDKSTPSLVNKEVESTPSLLNFLMPAEHLTKGTSAKALESFQDLQKILELDRRGPDVLKHIDWWTVKTPEFLNRIGGLSRVSWVWIRYDLDVEEAPDRPMAGFFEVEVPIDDQGQERRWTLMTRDALKETRDLIEVIKKEAEVGKNVEKNPDLDEGQNTSGVGDRIVGDLS